MERSTSCVKSQTAPVLIEHIGGTSGRKKTKHGVTSDQEITINATRINLAIKLVSKMIIINRDHKSVNVNSRRRFDPARA